MNGEAESAPTTPETPLVRARRAALHALVPCLILAMIAYATVALIRSTSQEHESSAARHMRDVADELSENVESLAEVALTKTLALAEDPRLDETLASGSREEAEALANAMLASALELDIVALFDADGRLLAVNSIDHDGVPIAPDRLARLYATDYSSRDVVQSCLRDQTISPRMQFQTACDFTPPMFDSSGLSVALSAPVVRDGVRTGVVSTRLRFDRVSGLIRDNLYARAGNDAFLLSDDGRFFDESINGGEQPQPLPPDLVRSVLTVRGRGGADGDIVHHDDSVLVARQVPVGPTVDGGGINILLRADRAWITAEAAQARSHAAATLACSVVALGAWTLYAVTRADRRRIRRALSAERSRVSLVLRSAAEGVLGLDGDDRITLANDAASRALGAPPEQLLGAELASIFPEHTPGTDWSEEDTPVLTLDGRSLRARASLTRLPGENGAVVTFSDQSRRIETEHQLREATRLAGRAEVATSVLHNVGNVLNSVNVSATLIQDHLSNSSLGDLSRASGLLSQHADDLGTFLSSDERGRHFPGFLAELASCLENENETLRREVESVMRGVEHVRHVVSVQQKHAKSESMLERVNPGRLIDDAIDLLRDSLSRHQVRIERDCRTDTPAMLDKHQTLQILLNLIKNAKQATAGVERDDRLVTVSARRETEGGESRVVFEVTDNGVGIDPAHLDQIFAHGFTTRRDGHGFGLHSAANAARAMDGSIEVFSQGLGRGATFRLTLPAPEDDPTLDHAAPSAPANGEPACTAS